MWIFLNNAMLSIVEPKHDGKAGTAALLMVRARVKWDIERVFPDARVLEDAGTDYRFRALVPREAVVKKIADQIRKIDYGNFKNSITDDCRHDAYLRVWSVMADEQERQR
jgi:hypothetical protein